MCSAGNNQLYGYAGKLLRVDLSTEKISVEKIESQTLRKFLGGAGYGAKLLYDEVPAGVDPLGVENKLIFTTGPLTGTQSPGSGFAEVCCKSPLTGVWSEARCGGGWGGWLAGTLRVMPFLAGEALIYHVIYDRPLIYHGRGGRPAWHGTGREAWHGMASGPDRTGFPGPRQSRHDTGEAGSGRDGRIRSFPYVGILTYVVSRRVRLK